MLKFITLENVNWAAGIAAIGLAIAGFASGDYAGGMSNVVAALVAFGVKLSLNQSQQAQAEMNHLVRHLSKKGML